LPSHHGSGSRIGSGNARFAAGHASAAGLMPGDVDFLNREVGVFLDGVTGGAKKVN
jgi:homoserine O-acetyltransferase